MQKISDLIVKFRWLILFSIFIITVFFSYQFKFLEVDSNIIDALPQDDPVVRLFKDVGKKYGGTEIGMVVLESDNVFRSEVLKRIEMITDSLMGIDGHLSVNSIILGTQYLRHPILYTFMG